MLNDLQRRNLREIEGLNQRGGRTLSFVDLIHAGTMSAEMIAHCWTAIAHGASFLTAARPGGAGKSTVLANLLALLPDGEQIITYSDPDIVPPAVRRCYLAHEIGSGHWYGYIWGAEVHRFLSLRNEGHRIASCLHADTLRELSDILHTPPLNVSTEEINAMDLILFVHVHLGQRRRVAALYEAAGDGHRLAFALDDDDRIVRQGESALLPRLGAEEAEYEKRLDFVRRLMAEGETRLAAVRERVLSFPSLS